MEQDARFDAWTEGQNYEHYMGRWSRKIADRFLAWLAPEPGLHWLELGCGTGALSSAILLRCSPKTIVITDRSEDFLRHTQRLTPDPRAEFQVADAQSLPFVDARFDVVTSALTLNFVQDKAAALSEMQRVAKPGGMIGFFVWDYPGSGIGFIDAFWKAAARLDPAAAALDEGNRFPFCNPAGLAGLCNDAGLAAPIIDPIEIATEFPDFEAFWQPFTLGAGPAPGYCRTLSEDRRAALKALLAETLGGADLLHLKARAWAVKARVPGEVP